MGRFACLKHGCVVVTSLLLVHPAIAQSDTTRFNSFVFSWENDFFARGRTTDRWYTNGLHLAIVGLPFVEAPPTIAKAILLTEDQPSVSSLIGQNMYTPRRIDIREPQPNDRPWGGFLYIGAGASEYAGQKKNWHRAADVKVGLIGPASYAREVQRAWHELIDAIEPVGWDNQLRPRLGVQASYMATYRWRDFSALDALGVQPYGRLTAGNTKVAAVLGTTLILGERDRVIGATDEGDFLSTDTTARTNYFKTEALKNWTFYAQAQVARVWRNHFITGTTFRDQPDLRIKTHVFTTALGVTWKVTKSVSIQYALKRRTPEFELADLTREEQYQRYGEIRLTAILD